MFSLKNLLGITLCSHNTICTIHNVSPLLFIHVNHPCISQLHGPLIALIFTCVEPVCARPASNSSKPEKRRRFMLASLVNSFKCRFKPWQRQFVTCYLAALCKLLYTEVAYFKPAVSRYPQTYLERRVK